MAEGDPPRQFRLHNMHGPTIYVGTYAEMVALARRMRGAGPYRVHVDKVRVSA